MKQQSDITETANSQMAITKGKVESINRNVWFYLIKHFGLIDQQIAPLMSAMIIAHINGEQAILVRIYDPVMAKEKNIEINDYESLNVHSDLVLYEGYYTRSRKRQITIVKKEEGKRSLLDAKLTSGEITDIGLEPKKTSFRKWSGDIGTFMAMGGFLGVVALFLAILLLIGVIIRGC